MTGILAEGQLFLGKYRVEKLIGRGGMGAVYAAIDIDLARKVAIKVLLPQIATSRTAASRFVNEGRAAARIEGEHVARIFAAGRTEDGLSYMVLELLEGIDLADHLTQRGRLGVAEAVDIVLEALEAVEEAHRHGIIHRDLKPGNLFLHRRGNGAQVVKVLDFGISKRSHPFSDTSGEQELTMTRALLGSPFYMSPEQLQDSKSVDTRTDIWSLGIILYEMLAGIVPFRGDTLHDLFHAIIEQPVLPLGNWRPDIPPALHAVVARCLERDLKRRFALASEVTRALTPFGSRASASYGRPMNFAVPKMEFDDAQEFTVQQTQLWIPTHAENARAHGATVTPSRGYPDPKANTVTPSRGHPDPNASTVTPSRGYPDPNATTVTPAVGYVDPNAMTITPEHGYSDPNANTVTPSHGHAAAIAQSHGAWSGNPARQELGASIRRTRRAMIVLAIAVPAAIVFLGSFFAFSFVLGPKDPRRDAVKTALSAASSSAARALGATPWAATPSSPNRDAAPQGSAHAPAPGGGPAAPASGAAAPAPAKP
ncbi:protein kinase domain-containing protein [Pendulispora albinea]|uniref:Protein kinase n=1 Tax=Pendulispora albinea TaxID=2741071 RepID=A0ABZ2M0U8_9BACT